MIWNNYGMPHIMHINEVDDAVGEGKLVGKQKLYFSGKCTISCAQIGYTQLEQFALEMGS